MINNQVVFVKSSSKISECPPPELPEYAFIGRSNVGKSSLINAITHRKVANTSAQPGKTQLINHFSVDKQWYLTDLPGYGYAKVSKTKRAEFGVMIKDYLRLRPNLMCAFTLVDVRIEPQQNDLDFMDWLGEHDVPFVIVFTKADKLKGHIIKRSVEEFKKKFLEKWEEMPPYFITSSEKMTGIKEIVNFIEQTNKSFVKPE